jgi:hypothetical protein
MTELLVDGVLARQDILNRHLLKSALHPDTPIDWTALFPLSACLAAELWLQGWANRATGGQCPVALATTTH